MVHWWAITIAKFVCINRFWLGHIHTWFNIFIAIEFSCKIATLFHLIVTFLSFCLAVTNIWYAVVCLLSLSCLYLSLLYKCQIDVFISVSYHIIWGVNLPPYSPVGKFFYLSHKYHYLHGPSPFARFVDVKQVVIRGFIPVAHYCRFLVLLT